MKNFMIKTTFFTGFLWLVLLLIYHWLGYEILNTIAITFGVTFYHFFMRLIVGAFIGAGIGPRLKFKSTWFQEKSFEKRLYGLLKVKAWKKHIPTYDSAEYDIKKLSFEQIYENMCKSELVHETIIVFCFLPIIFSVYINQIEVLIITSVISAALDLTFVIVQRYNRFRIIKFINRVHQSS